MLFPNPLSGIFFRLYLHYLNKHNIPLYEEIKRHDNCDNAKGEETED